MADVKRKWVRQAFMKRSFMRRRTTAIYDCWLDPEGVLVAVLAKAHTRRAIPETRRLGAQAQTPTRAKGLNENNEPGKQGKCPHQSHEHGKPREQPEVDGRDEVG